ncbi:MAG: hypothetical protein Q8P82_02040, partial [bacterium]|nr:hypothetical protein [bacterium]
GTNEDGTDVFVNFQDSQAYITRTLGDNSTANPELAIINVANPAVPTVIGSLNFGSSVQSVYAADTLMFTATANANEEFQIYEITDPIDIQYYSGLNFPQVATDIAFENNTIYVSVRSNEALRIITSQ